jgi:uncharacterized protein (UPF0262 family)
METLTDLHCLNAITLDEGTIIRRADHIEAERACAINDLLAVNRFAPTCVDAGPYELFLSTRDNKLLFRVSSPNMAEPRDVVLPLQPFKRIIKDYFLLCESYFNALDAEAHKLEAIDMGRRSIHNEGSELLQETLKERIILDFPTARRLFTLICVLHIK